MDTQVEIYTDPVAGITANAPKVEPMPEMISIVLASLGEKITDAETAAAASQLLGEITKYEQRVKLAFDEHTRAADRLHKFLTGLRSMALVQVGESKRIVKTMLLDWQTEQAREAREARQRQIEEMNRLRAAEKLRLEQEAIQAALENPPEAAQEELSRVETAASALPQVIPPAPVAAPKLAGVTTRTYWKYRVIDIIPLARAVIAGSVPADCLAVNDQFFAVHARQTKGDSPYPGIEYYSESTIQKG